MRRPCSIVVQPRSDVGKSDDVKSPDDEPMSPDSLVGRVCIASKFERMQQACFIIF
jgi:hypothetical protein